MKREIDIYDSASRLDQAVKRLQQREISDANKNLILEFRDVCSTEGMCVSRIERYIIVLYTWAKILDKNFPDATKEDIMKAVRVVQENRDYAPWTKATYKIMLKRFYKWLRGSTEMPPEVKWISAKIKKNEEMLPSNGDLLSETEISRAVGLAEHPRDKALISILYESGARIGELASLQIGNIKFDEYGATLRVTGKTGSRPIRVISSTPHLVNWLNNHPFKDNPGAPLWICIGSMSHHQVMKYPAVSKMIRQVFKRAGIKKRCNPHIFRHSRATFLADHLTEFQMNQFFGWRQGSNMPSTYVHMSGKKIDSSILALNGIHQPTETSESELKPKICPRCDTINASDAKYCTKCAGLLDFRTACELEQKIREQKEARSKADEFMNFLMKDSEFMNLVQKRLKEINGTAL